jgi:signal transduction histidine kinase
MHWFGNLPIRHKVTVLIALTSTLTLLLAAAAAAAGDGGAAAGVLLNLRSQPEIVFATLFGLDGRVVAQYLRSDMAPEEAPTSAPAPGHRFEGSRLVLARPVSYHQEEVGRLVLCADTRELRLRFEGGVSLLAVVLLASMLVAVFLAARLQRLLADPILELSNLAQQVATQQNYALRGRKRHEDEIGRLTDHFNAMLAQIQARDAALLRSGQRFRQMALARRRLEGQVVEVSEREQARFGRDLHDGLCQLLVSIGFNASLLKQDLQARRQPEGARAERVEQRLAEAARLARHLSHGLCPLETARKDLPTALRELARATAQDFGVACAAECVSDLAAPEATAAQLYRIVHEAVHNAVKHAHARCINITLAAAPERFHLTVADDGVGFPDSLPAQAGLGLQIMRYRAGAVGGTFEVRRGEGGGTVVCCSVPILEQSAWRNPA